MTTTLDRMMNDALAVRFSRRGFFKGPVLAGAGALALSALGGSFAQPALVAAAPPLDTDLQILNYALTLEHLEAAAYRAINQAGILSGRAATYFQSFGQHEAEHVTALVATIQKLGGTPVQPATYNFSSVPKDAAGVVQFFQNVESVGASAYLGAAPSIKDFGILEAALAIHAVEAEHTSALADLVSPGSDLFAPEAFATPRTPDQVMQIVAPFFAAAPAASAAPAAPPAQMPSAMPRTGGGYGAGFIRRLGDG